MLTDADLREDPRRQEHHPGGGELGHGRERQGQDPGQGGHPSGPAAPHLRRQAAGRRPHLGRLQHPEGVHAPPRPPPPWWWRRPVIWSADRLPPWGLASSCRCLPVRARFVFHYVMSCSGRLMHLHQSLVLGRRFFFALVGTHVVQCFG
ncbi:hypothetical protein Zm00014a_028650 [Zea mays]|uniref:Uncharacterized protein n=1 Tax=Zea mays TaxID=4577 RepID=A0A3L6D948_MAIZE|nr:hypothetical protein Zm00014a_028650 [Zea mays]